jgi:hypothetical protein
MSRRAGAVAACLRTGGLVAAVWLFVSGCSPQPDATGAAPDPQARAEAVRQRLVGTWLREYEQEGTRVRRILVLNDDGKFTETYRVDGQSDAGLSPGHTGTWLFDGTNLKRHYQYIDGKQTTRASVLFAALDIRFSGNHEFTGTDHVRKRAVRYARVEAGTLP